MVAFPYSVRRDTAMVSSRWILLAAFYLLCQLSKAKNTNQNRIYGDVNSDDVAIDHLEEYLRSRSLGRQARIDDSLPQYMTSDQYPLHEVPEKIPFAVAPRDPRYFMSSSVLRGEPPSEDGEHEAYSDYPAQFMEDLGLIEGSHGASRHDQVYHHPAAGGQHVQYPQVHEHPPHQSPPASNYEDFPDSPLYPPVLHRVDNYPPAEHELYVQPKMEDYPTSQPEAVNFLQQSRHQAQQPNFLMKQPSGSPAVLSDFYFVALVAGCTAAAVCTVLGAGICYYRLHKSKRDAAEAEYPAYGVTGPNKDLSPGAADRKLAQSAHMFHYQHQKQQMIALEKSSEDERHCSASDVDSEEEGEEGDYTVYECPGLAPTGEMEVKNPLFSDDPTPATPAPAPNSTKGTNDARIEVDDTDDDKADGD